MVDVTKHGVILEKTDNDFENEGVINPAIFQDGNTIHMFYRAVRKGNFSSIGYCKLDGPLNVVERFESPVFYPEENYESHGVEDPRITKIEDTYYMAYAAYDGLSASGAYATSKDLLKFDRKGIITPKCRNDEYIKLLKHNFEKISSSHFIFYNKLANLMKGKIVVWDKDIVFFPKKINGKLAALHRLYPSIQILYFNEPSELTPEFWREYISDLRKHIVMFPEHKHENSHIGAGCPPIETDEGWLLIYHSVQFTSKGNVYHASAALLDLENPLKVIAKLRQPLFSPTEVWEKDGYVSNVVFPTGTALFNDELYIYYGAADSRIAVASININKLLLKLKNL